MRKIEIKRNKKMYLYMCKNLWGKREIEIESEVHVSE